MKRTYLSEDEFQPRRRSRLCEYVAENGNVDGLTIRQKVGSYFNVVTSGDNDRMLTFLKDQIDPGFYYPEILMRCVRLLSESDVYLRSLLAMRRRYPEHQARLLEVFRGEHIDPVIKASITDFLEREAAAMAPVSEVMVLDVPSVFSSGDATMAVEPSFGTVPTSLTFGAAQQHQQHVSDFDAGYVPGVGIQAPMMMHHVSVDDQSGDENAGVEHAGAEQDGNDPHIHLSASLQQERDAAAVSYKYQLVDSEDEWSGTETDEEELRRDYMQQVDYD